MFINLKLCTHRQFGEAGWEREDTEVLGSGDRGGVGARGHGSIGEWGQVSSVSYSSVLFMSWVRV